MSHEIQRTDVTELPAKGSSLIKSVGYDSKEWILQVEFQSGSIWNYGNVSQGEAEAIMQDSSIGSKFIKHVRDIKPSEAVQKTGRGTQTVPVRRPTEKPLLGVANAQIRNVHESRNIQQIIRESSRTEHQKKSPWN